MTSNSYHAKNIIANSGNGIEEAELEKLAANLLNGEAEKDGRMEKVHDLQLEEIKWKAT